MIKLIKANLYRMFKSYTLYLILATAVLLSLVFFLFTTAETDFFRTGFSGDVTTLYMNRPLINDNYSFDISALSNLIIENALLLIALSSFFIAIFAGKNFNDGAIRNTLMVGHKKSSIYLTAFIINIISSFIIALALFISTSVYMLLAGLKPLIWWPYVIIMILLMYLFALVMSSLVMMIVFVTRRTFVAIIAAIVLFAVFMFIPGSQMVNNELMFYTLGIDVDYMADDTSRITVFFDDDDYREVYRIDGKEIRVAKHFKDLSSETKARVCFIKSFPFSFFSEYTNYEMNPYILVKGKAASRYAAASAVWIVLSTFAGVMIFRKKDII